MEKTRLGFDIGSTSLKIAVLRGGASRIEEVRLPEDITEETGTAGPPRLFAQFLKRT